MGIPYLFKEYYIKYNREGELVVHLENLNTLDISYLFFDYNSLIHPCAHQNLLINENKYLELKNKLSSKEFTNVIEDDIIKNCFNYTKLVINMINNKEMSQLIKVFIVIDGVAPRSKMNQQRERRFKSHYFKEILPEEKNSFWDSNKITPGTHFMNKLHIKLLEFKKEFENEHSTKIEISSADEPGEGEHKMMRIIENLKYDSQFNINKKILIYGLDCDLIMLSMINKKSKNIILIRDNSFSNNDERQVSNIDFVDIFNLKHLIYQDITREFGLNNKNINFEKDKLIYDYIMICFFLGNDFLDHLPSINIKSNGLSNIIRAYIKAYKGRYLIEDSIINLEYLKDIFYNLKIQENYFMSSKFNIQFKENNNICINDNYYSNIFFYKLDTDEENLYKNKNKYYTFYGINNDMIDDACFNYIEGLYWILGYYNNHSHCNWNWYYKYLNTPFCSDIFNFLNKNWRNISIKFEKTECYSNLKQLCLVLPKNSLKSTLLEIIDMNLDTKLNKKYSHQIEFLLKLINNLSGDLSNYLFPEKLYVDLNNKEYLWQSKILFQKIDDKLLDVII